VNEYINIQGDQEIRVRFSNQKKKIRQQVNILKFGEILANFH